MLNQFSRTQLALGTSAMGELSSSRVAVFGIGGVGGHVVEALVRSGVGAVDIIDKDTVSFTNLNRQIIATHSTVGLPKVDVMEQRILDINPDCVVRKYQCFFLPENADQFDFSQYDYVVDAVDTVTAKMQIITMAKANDVPVISSMGAGNKLNPTMFQVADIYETSVDKLAKVIRKECRKRGIDSLKVVYSQEMPLVPTDEEALADVYAEAAEEGEDAPRKIPPSSNAFVPSVAGLIIASEVIKDLTGVHND